MKRKRGPAPHGEKGRLKQVSFEKVEDATQSDEEMDIPLEEEDSFEGFSSDDDETFDKPTVQDEGKKDPVNGNSKAERKRGKKAAPTQEELMDLLYRSSSFQSNLFKLQVDELLSEVRVKYDKMEKVETILHKLKDILTHLPESREQLVFSSFK